MAKKCMIFKTYETMALMCCFYIKIRTGMIVALDFR